MFLPVTQCFKQQDKEISYKSLQHNKINMQDPPKSQKVIYNYFQQHKIFMFI